MQFFRLKKHSKACDRCHGDLQSEFYSSLSDDELRRDCCSDCFITSEKPSIWWRTKIEVVVKPIVLSEYENKQYSRFTSAIEEKSRSDEWIYFLAHYFKRRKIFQSQGEFEKEGKFYEIFECRVTNEVYIISKSPPGPLALQEILQDVHPS